MRPHAPDLPGHVQRVICGTGFGDQGLIALQEFQACVRVLTFRRITSVRIDLLTLGKILNNLRFVSGTEFVPTDI